MNLYRFANKEKLALAFIIIGVLVVMLLTSPEIVPQPWFDEGWTLTVAKNLVEHGKYALQLDNNWVSPKGMSQPFSATLLVALSFRIFGVGLLQGRLPTIILTGGCLFLLFELARNIFGKRTAWMTLAVLLLFVPDPRLNPLVYGRQAVGEIPMLFYLLLGYWFWKQGLKGSRWGIVAAGLFWGLALGTKRQTLPFWLVSLFTVILLAYIRKDIKIFFTTLAASGVACFFLLLTSQIEQSLVGAFPLNGAPVQGLYALLTWTFNPKVRLDVLQWVLLFCLSSALGLVYSFQFIKKLVRDQEEIVPEGWLQISLFALASSWYVWFVFGSIGWSRYYQPALMVSAPFFAKVLVDCISKLQWQSDNQPPVVSPFTFIRKTFSQPVILLAFLVVSEILVLEVATYRFLLNQKPQAQLTAEYINEHSEPDALVETYESEMFFLLQRPYHYPPDQVQIDLNRRTFLYENNPINYDPLAANPDYLIVGPYAKIWGLYDQEIQAGDFQLVKQIYNYDIYKHVIKK